MAKTELPLEMIDLTIEDRNTTAKEELEIEIIYENLPKVQKIEIKPRMRSSNKSLKVYFRGQVLLKST